MIIVKENACRLNIQLDRIQQHVIEKLHAGDQALDFAGLADGQQSPSHQIADLWHAIQSLSITSKTQALLPPDKIVDLISGVSRLLPQRHDNTPDVFVTHKSDLIWLVTAKAAVQTLGLVLGSLVKQTHVLNDEVLYWDDILASYWYTGFHAIQTTPTRIWHGVKSICFYKANQDTQDQHRAFLSSRWTHFYDLVRRSIYAQPVYTVPARISSHFAIHRSDIRQKQRYLKMTKDLHSSGIGILMEECLSFNIEDLSSTPGNCKALEDRWRNTVSRIVVLMETILYNSAGESAVADFEHKIFTTAHAEEFSIQNQLYDSAIPGNPAIFIGRLVHILKDHFPKYAASSNELVQKHGRPSCVVRCWLPFSLLFFSSYTSLKILTNRRTEIIGWVVNIGSTAVDFWSNWVLEPIQRLIGTIRHDKESEIAIMSKNSLEADRASLERMVVDFIQDQNDLSATDTHTIMNSVKEGDLTPVLKAYERDLRSPFVGTIRGDLIRALLIQIQKTKVDVEVAISGIDSLLKSQELVFGFVGLTPGILVSYAVSQWFFGLFGSRKGLRKSKEQSRLRHALRNVDRTLASSSHTANGFLTYRDHGLLICDAEFLLQRAEVVLKGADLRMFNEDIGDLINIQRGADRQLQVVRRIGWTYSRWLQ